MPCIAMFHVKHGGVGVNGKAQNLFIAAVRIEAFYPALTPVL